MTDQDTKPQNPEPDPDVPNPDGAAAPEQETGACQEFRFLRNLFDNIDNAVKRGADKASKTANRAAPKVKRAVSKGAYAGAYGIAYTAVLGALVARQVLKDNVILDGAKDGFAAARKAAEEPGLTHEDC
jgi:hypothetical protein